MSGFISNLFSTNNQNKEYDEYFRDLNSNVYTVICGATIQLLIWSSNNPNSSYIIDKVKRESYQTQFDYIGNMAFAHHYRYFNLHLSKELNYGLTIIDIEEKDSYLKKLKDKIEYNWRMRNGDLEVLPPIYFKASKEIQKSYQTLLVINNKDKSRIDDYNKTIEDELSNP